MAKKSIQHDGINYDISYEILNIDKQDTILFLHGWGASKSMMKQAFSNSFDNHKLVFVDLPGFGSSSIQKPLDSYEYKEILSSFLNSLGVDIYMIFGHSFGGKIATLLNPKRLVLLSSAGIVLEKSFEVRCKIKIFKFLKKIGLEKYYRYFASKDVNKMSEVMYETFKKVVDERFDEHFSCFKGEALIFWGDEDTATPLKSGKIIHNLMDKSKFHVYNGNHFFFLAKHEEISKVVKEQLCT